ncbi:MAG TPA: hypothetical protein VJP45_07325, partial [Candidatus Limnocylindria bacterium]|nr:hypothetical protein [Candidatus Limnocylindria bacterium]
SWQYHSRSDRHSKIACWGILFDLLRRSALMRAHVETRKAVFGVNHQMRDYKTGRKKNLDLVVARPANGAGKVEFADLVDHYDVVLTDGQRSELEALPPAEIAPVGSVLMALEAKACMTEHVKARPRLYDELNSSHLTVHGASRQAIAVGFVMVNLSSTFVSPDLNKFTISETSPAVITTHSQPRVTESVIEKLREIPRRSAPSEEGFDALGIVVVECANDGTPVAIVKGSPAPSSDDIHHYDRMIDRVQHMYEVTFKDI